MNTLLEKMNTKISNDLEVPKLKIKVIDLAQEQIDTESVDFKKSGVTSDTSGSFKVHVPYGEWVIKVSYVG